MPETRDSTENDSIGWTPSQGPTAGEPNPPRAGPRGPPAGREKPAKGRRPGKGKRPARRPGARGRAALEPLGPLDLFFANHPEPMWVFDRETLAFLAVNPAAVRRYGYTRDEFLGMTIKDIRPPEDVPSLLETVAGLGPGSHVGRVWRHRTKDGRTIRAQITSLGLEYGGRPARLVLARDASEEARAEQDRRLLDFAMFVVHQVSTPLTNIAILSRGLARSDLRAEDRERVEGIDRQRRIVATLLSSLQRFSRTRSLDVAEVDARDLLQGALQQVIALRADGVRLTLHAPEGPVAVRADATLLREVFVNLMKNALQATSEGSVDVALEPGADGAVVEVRDTGAGMPPEVLGRLFHSLFSTKPLHEGAGLGLAFCRIVVEAHGGTIDATSEVGRGSIFRVRLPRSPPAAG